MPTILGGTGFLTVRELAEAFGISVQAARMRIRGANCPTQVVGRLALIKVEDAIAILGYDISENPSEPSEDKKSQGVA